ncbi:oligosaccharide flippase family protein [Yinghuangia seranimata]|uniref:oligosaccharide flippase family protein n=1 Tax=Yinghuangia seranimata TaxID=408067 RepID=UPI00248B4DB1|nr:oligosaccharide flippase family protein [Yinghuangia seranimata]MDI2124566.1 oligosaccharide flippase family protein [Yinghuangia seranimata]
MARTDAVPAPSAAAPAAPPANAGARATLSALAWNYSAAVAGALLQLCYTGFTARVVAPREFGAYAAAAAALTVFGYVAGAGLSTYLLRAEVLTRGLVRTAYRAAFASGALCFVATMLFAPTAATLWGMPEIEPVVQLFGCYFLTQPASLVATAGLRRMGRARAAALAETGAQFAGMAAGAVLLTAGWSPYGLVAASCLTPTVTLLVAAPLMARCVLPTGDRVTIPAVLGVSGAFALYGILQMVTMDAALWAVARHLGPDAAGQFSRALLAVSLPASLLAQALRRAVMPAMAEVNGGGGSLRGVPTDVLNLGSALGCVSFGVLAGVGQPALRLLLGPGWGAAGILVTVFAVCWPLMLLCQLGYAVDEVAKELLVLFRVQLLVLAATSVLLTAAVAGTGSLVLTAAASPLAAGVGHVAQLVRWRRVGLCAPATLVRPYLVHAALGTALGVAGWVGVHSIDAGAELRLLTGLLAMVPVGLAAYAVRRWIPVYEAAVARGLVRR